MGLRDLFSRKPKPQPQGYGIPYAAREALFGDMPITAWPGPDSGADLFPWTAFVQARGHLAAGDTQAAIRCWLQVAEATGEETLHTAQAWHFLRAHGHSPPPEKAKQVLGTVLEYGLEGGLDLVAAYTDHNARYYNHSGRACIWLEGGDGSLNERIDALLAASAEVVRVIGPWDQERPAAPPQGAVRISFITPSGLHFGQGRMDSFARDPMAGPVIYAAFQLMQGLMEKSDGGTPRPDA